MSRIRVQHGGVTHADRRHEIAAAVRAEMARAAKYQTDLAEVLDVPQQAVSMRLRGHRSFRAEELTAIAEWLGVPLDRLTGSEVAA